ncbi:MAG: hypothetical protein ABIT58_07070 [Ferruginibacter sp.]
MMRAIILVLVISVFLMACSKDKYTSAPQITYKSLTSNVYDNALGSTGPGIIFSITDAEGDIGDSATIHIKNLLTNDSIIIPFPNLNGATKKNFKAEITATVGRLSGCLVANPPGRIDSLYYELYVEDFAKNKSNTIVTADPIYQQCP